MRFTAAVPILVLLAMPAGAQNTAAHGNGSGEHGTSAHGNNSGRSRSTGAFSEGHAGLPFSGPRPGSPGFGAPRPGTPGYDSRVPLMPLNGYQFQRPIGPASLPFDSGGMPGLPDSRWDGDWHRGHDRDRDRDGRWRDRNGYLGYGYAVPILPGYINPYLSNEFNDQVNESPQSTSDVAPQDQYAPSAGYAPGAQTYQGSLAAEPPPAEAEELQRAVARPSYTGTQSAIAPLPAQPVVIHFKSGRAPERMQNFMITPTTLTDLDPQHYEAIPLDEVDIAATERANMAAGIQFKVPQSRN